MNEEELKEVPDWKNIVLSRCGKDLLDYSSYQEGFQKGKLEQIEKINNIIEKYPYHCEDCLWCNDKWKELRAELDQLSKEIGGIK